MNAGVVSLESPRCTMCGRDLVGIAAALCPGCGVDVVSDPAFRTPSLVRSSWSRLNPRGFVRGFFLVLTAPVKTLQLCESQRRIAASRALLFAALVTVLLAACWPVIKEVGLVVSMITLRDGWSLHDGWSRLSYQLTSRIVWRFNFGWEIWSVMRWWLLFAAAVLILPGQRDIVGSRTSRQNRFHRLLLFAPWIAMLEIGHLIGVWFVRQNVVPEPDTIFITWPAAPLIDVWTDAYWLTRAVVPTFAVGLVFGRAVQGWEWKMSIVFAAVLVPIGMIVSVLWSYLFATIGLIEWVHGIAL